MTKARDIAGFDYFPGRNLLYNGAMQIHQRGTSASSIGSFGYYTADRWNYNLSTLGTWTQTVENDAPTGTGLSKSLKFLCTTASASPAAGGYAIIEQRLEGFDVQRIAKGTASAQQLTMSFWVKSNVTGTYIATLQDGAGTARVVSASYSIISSGTWERKVVTFPADNAGSALTNDNSVQLYVRLFLSSGSNQTSSPLQTTWGTSFTNIAAGQVNVAASVNNYFQVTGVQLEVGTSATPFEFKTYGQELRECQRYYYQHIGGYTSSSAFSSVAPGSVYTTTESRGIINFPTTMRIAPALIVSNGSDHFRVSVNNGSYSFNTLTINGACTTNAIVISSAHSAITAGHGAQLISGNTTASSLAFNSEI